MRYGMYHEPTENEMCSMYFEAVTRYTPSALALQCLPLQDVSIRHLAAVTGDIKTYCSSDRADLKWSEVDLIGSDSLV
jgi:hypothetical protein